MKKPRHLSTDEKLLWDSVAQQVEPLKPTVASELQKPKFSEPSKPVEVFEPFAVGERAMAAKSQTTIQIGTVAPTLNMDSKSFMKLKQGKLKPEAKLDLHGMTIAQAHPALVRFLMNAHADKRRLVLIVTGKGNRDEFSDPFGSQRGVLRRQVPTWLSLAPLRSVVLQSVPANIRHGGEGALYVYLRRNR